MIMHKAPLIELINVRKIYRGRGKNKDERVIAIDDINLALDRGECLGLLGPNGAGKTTLIKMMCGLVKPTSGEVKIDGNRLEKVRNKALAIIGALLEGHRHVYWPMTVQENLLYFSILKGVQKKKLKEQIPWLLHFMDLEPKKDVPVRYLSQGMRQKLGMSVALLGNPDILLFDEPTNGLDVASLRQVKEKIKEISHKYKKGVIVSTHQMEVVADVCDRIVIIDRGRMLVNKAAFQLMNHFEGQYYKVFVSKLNKQNERYMSNLNIIAKDMETTDGPKAVYIKVLDANELIDVLNRLRDYGAYIHRIEQYKKSLEDIFIDILEGQRNNERINQV